MSESPTHVMPIKARGYEWEANAEGMENQPLARACVMEATPTLPNNNDALSWEPAPNNIRDIMKMPDGVVRQEWLKSVKKEKKTLVDSKAFVIHEMRPDEISTPVMEIFKVR
jgi:hypothetical protein